MKRSFSLIELSIVLIVVGFLIAAVMSGRDLIKSADSKEFYQTFVRKWTTIINSYYDRMNVHLSDGSTNVGFNSYSDGYFDGLNMSIDSNQTSLKNQLLLAGINPCNLLSTNCYFSNNTCNPTCYKIAGEFTDETTVQVYLNAYKYNSIPTNFIVFHNMPTDIAVTIDRLVDGKSDGMNGTAIAFEELGNYNNNTNIETITPINYANYTNKLVNLAIMIED